MAGHLILIGTSVAQGNMALLERLTVTPLDRPQILPELKNKLKVKELFYLATCNRVEVAVVCDKNVSPALIRNRLLDFFLSRGRDFELVPEDLYQFSAGEAVRHLFRVASSLESLVVGETQIIGQVKDAFRECSNLQLRGGQLDLLLQKAVQTARRVRNETGIGNGSLSMATLVINELEKHSGLSISFNVALVGSGEMSIKLAGYLRDKNVQNLLFVSRSLEKARQSAARYSGRAVSLDEFTLNPESIDIIVSATSASTPVFGTDFLKKLSLHNKKIICIDLAIPRDFSEEFRQTENIIYVDISDLQKRQQENLRKRFKELDKASDIADQEVRNFLRAQFENDLRPAMRQSFEESLQYAFDQCNVLYSSRLSQISPDEMRIIKSLVRRVVGFSSAEFSRTVARHFSQKQELLETSESESQIQSDQQQEEKSNAFIGTLDA